MSAQDKLERILKEIHLALAEGGTVSGDPDKVMVDKNKVFAVLEQLNVAVNELMDQYEATSQARELAQRRSEKKGQELLERVSRQADDIYAASLVYTDEALGRLQRLMKDTLASSRETWAKVESQLEKEQGQIRSDQRELREQLQDFKDSNKYLSMIEDCNRQREKQEKEKKEPEKKIQNEAKHYAAKEKPEIKINQAYFERRSKLEV